MTKEQFSNAKKVDYHSKIYISSKVNGKYLPDLIVPFFLVENGTALNSVARNVLSSFNDSYDLQYYDITVKHNKKSLDSIKQEKEVLLNFLATL